MTSSLDLKPLVVSHAKTIPVATTSTTERHFGLKLCGIGMVFDSKNK